MFFVSRSSMKSGRRVVVCALLVGLATLITFAIVVLKPNGTVNASTESTNPTSAIISQDTSRHLTAEVVTLHPTGFEPAQVTRSQGPFLLGVNNQTGREDLALWLERENGDREQQARFEGHRVRWRVRLDLPPGTYFLKVDGHTDWVCRITIN
jgi:hypothetical protein